MHCSKVLEANASCLPLRKDRADSHASGGALDLWLLYNHGTPNLHEARRIHCDPELADWALYKMRSAKAYLHQQAHAPASPRIL